MGNYFRQIYTGSHAEWWTTVFDPRRQGKAAEVFSRLESTGMGGWDGGRRGREGGWWREAKVR